jgi:putative Mg2+ transporter-C (MgtC) family protein
MDDRGNRHSCRGWLLPSGHYRLDCHPIILGVFRAVETRLPSEFYAHHTIKFTREAIIPEPELRALIGRHGFTIANLSHRLTEMGKVFEYRMVIRTRDRDAAEQLSQHLCTLPGIIEFRIAPTGD